MFQGNDDTKIGLRAAVQIVEEFRRFDPKMEANQILMFLLIASKPGVRFKDLEDALNLSSSAVSRNVQTLSSQSYARRGEEGGKGHDLVTSQDDPLHGRAKIAAPTSRGRRLAERVGEIIKGASQSYGTA